MNTAIGMLRSSICEIIVLRAHRHVRREGEHEQVVVDLGHERAEARRD